MNLWDADLEPTDVPDPVWLLKADPAIIYLGSVYHCVACVGAILILVILWVAMPWYIFLGVKKDMTLFEVGKLQRSLSDAAAVLSRSIDVEVDEEVLDTKANQAARKHLMEQSELMFSPMYTSVKEDVMHWWFFVDIAKKGLVSLLVAVGENDPNSQWKGYIFLVISAFVVIHGSVDPSPNRTSDCFELSTSVLVLLILYLSVSHARKDSLESLLLIAFLVLVCKHHESATTSRQYNPRISSAVTKT